MLIQICGLPGTGKSTLATGLADHRPVVLLHIDAIEAAMRRNGLTPDQTGVAAYSVAHAIALPHLRRGQTVVADAVSAVGAARQGWVGTAEHAGVPLRVVETVCPDPAEHRRRVTTGGGDLPGPTWSQVEAVTARYEARDDDRLVVDTRRDPDTCVREVLDYLDRG